MMARQRAVGASRSKDLQGPEATQTVTNGAKMPLGGGEPGTVLDPELKLSNHHENRVSGAPVVESTEQEHSNYLLDSDQSVKKEEPPNFTIDGLQGSEVPQEGSERKLRSKRASPTGSKQLSKPAKKPRKPKDPNTKLGRPRKYHWDAGGSNEGEAASEFEVSELDLEEIANYEKKLQIKRRQTSRWVCYSEAEEKMFLHWLIQGRSLMYVANAYGGMRSKNGIYQKMASIRRQFSSAQIKVDKNGHYDVEAPRLCREGPIPPADVLAFKYVLHIMRNTPSLKQRISGATQETTDPA